MSVALNTLPHEESCALEVSNGECGGTGGGLNTARPSWPLWWCGDRVWEGIFFTGMCPSLASLVAPLTLIERC